MDFFYGIIFLTAFIAFISTIVVAIMYLMDYFEKMDKIEKEILSTAFFNCGNFTLPLISYKTGFKISWCQKKINQLIKKGIVDLNVQNNGSFKYNIKEFESEEISKKQLTQ